uniref:Uncharacterized protein n=1 Tax=Anguilla anguilla TaxID=7936 RepID=A0A0E9USR3_ANGAN
MVKLFSNTGLERNISAVFPVIYI